MATMVNLTINGKDIQAPEGTTLLEAAKSEGIFIPTLCHHEALEPEGTCRLCIVEISGAIRHSIRISCIQQVQEGLVVETDTERIKKSRRLILELLLGRSPYSKELLDLASKCGVMTSRFLTDCIGCGSCAQVCPTGAIKIEDRGNERKIYTWGQVLARFKLEKCKECGRPYAPKKYLDRINERAYKTKGLELVDYVCPECVKKAERPTPIKMPFGGGDMPFAI